MGAQGSGVYSGAGVTFGIYPKLKLMMKIVRERERKQNTSQAMTKAMSFVKERTVKNKD